MPQPQSPFPPIPAETVQQGGRWQHHAPSSEQVAAWFATQPIDEGLDHASFVGGVVIIPQSMKVKYARLDGNGTAERHEMTYTPYVQIGTRLGYFRRLAEVRGLRMSIEPEPVPRSKDPSSIYFNGNMPDGLWWHVVRGDGNALLRYLCATTRVALYEPLEYAAKLRKEPAIAAITATGTKQVSGGPDPNGLMKAQTGSIGRALGVAGILVVGTGIATAEDMQEFAGLAAPPVSADQAQLPDALPTGAAPEQVVETVEALRTRAMSLQAMMQEVPGGAVWATFATWWAERAQSEGWSGIDDVPFDALKGIVSKMERDLAAGQSAVAAAQAAGQPAAVADAPTQAAS